MAYMEAPFSTTDANGRTTYYDANPAIDPEAKIIGTHIEAWAKEEIKAAPLPRAGVVETIKIAASSAVKIAAAAMNREPVYVDDATREIRWGICQECEELVHGICRQCNCFMLNKTKVAPVKCELGKW